MKGGVRWAGSRGEAAVVGALGIGAWVLGFGPAGAGEVAGGGVRAEGGSREVASLVDSTRDPFAEGGSEAEHLTGDWGGWRTRLLERGVHLQAGYIGEVFGVMSGGLRRGAVYEGVAEFALELESGPLTGFWPGGLFRVSAIVPHGRSPSGELAGDLLTLSNIDADDGVALYELWLEQNFAGDRISLRAGQLLADTEFAFTDYGGALLNSTFGWPAGISANTRNSGPAYYRAAPGVRLRVTPWAEWQLQVGVYDGDPFDADGSGRLGNDHGTGFGLGDGQGTFALAEVQWRPGFGGGESLVKVGAWGHTAEFEDVEVSGREHEGNGGVYLAGQHLVWREERDRSEAGAEEVAQGLGLFGRMNWAPADRNLLEFAGDAGLHYRGLWPGRDGDVLALGVAVGRISPDVRRAERADGVSPLSDRETVVELTYQANLRPWLAVQPCVQWVRHPGGSSALDDVWAAALRFRVTF